MKKYFFVMCVSMMKLFNTQAMENTSECPCERFLSKKEIMKIASYTGADACTEKSLCMLGALCHEYDAAVIKEKAHKLIVQNPSYVTRNYCIGRARQCEFDASRGVAGMFDLGSRDQFCYDVCEKRDTIKNFLKKKLQICNAAGCQALYEIVEEAERELTLQDEKRRQEAYREAEHQEIKRKQHIENQYKKLVQQNIE